MQNKTVIIYAAPVPECYGSLKSFCKVKKIPYNTYIRKKFPFGYKGYMVHKVVPETSAGTDDQMSNSEFADMLSKSGDALKTNDMSALLVLKEVHEKAFEKWCKNNPYAGTDDQMENDITWIGKALKFLIKRGYLK